MIADGAFVKVCAAGLLWLAVVKVGHGAGDAAAAAPDLPELKWYPVAKSENGVWGAKCFEAATLSPLATCLNTNYLPGLDEDKKNVEVTIAAQYDDSFEWTCASVVKGDCQGFGPGCVRFTAEVKSGDLKKSHKMTKDGKTYYYEGSELHVGSEHCWLGGAAENVAVAELQMRFTRGEPKTAGANRLAFVVGFQSSTEGTAEENAFLTALMDATKGTAEYADGGKIERKVAQTDDQLFTALDVGEFLKPLIDKYAFVYNGTETHPACEDQIMVVSPTLIAIKDTQVKALEKYIGIMEGASNYKGNKRHMFGSRGSLKTKVKMTRATAKTSTSTSASSTVATQSTKTEGNAGAAQSPKVAFVVAGSLLAMTAVAAM